MQKVVMVIFIVLTISFSALYFINELYRTNYDVEKWESEFYSQDFPNERKIFLIGSSYIVRFNQTYVEEYLHKNNENYTVYNLGRPVDLPIYRINDIDMIVSSEPDIVVYGLGFRDLSSTNLEHNIIIPNRIKDLEIYTKIDDTKSVIDISKYLTVKNISIIDVDNFQNPKFVSLKIIEMVNDGNLEALNKKPHKDPKHPFQGQGIIDIWPPEKLQRKAKHYQFSHPIEENSINIKALDIMLSKFQENNIKVILLITPMHELALAKVPQQQIKEYHDIMNDLSKKYNFPILNLQNKYSELEVWNDFYHVGYHPDSYPYYEDVSEEILMEIRS